MLYGAVFVAWPINAMISGIISAAGRKQLFDFWGISVVKILASKINARFATVVSVQDQHLIIWRII